MNVFNQVKRSARRASFEAERVLRGERAQAQISALNGQLRNGITRLGHLTYDLAQRGEIAHADVREVCAQLDGLRAQIGALEAEIEAIRSEIYTGEPESMQCTKCGAVWTTGAPYCARCGAPLAPPEGRTAARSVACSRCAAINAPGTLFCVQCGQSLTAQVVSAHVVAAPLPQSTQATTSDTGMTPASRLQAATAGHT